MSSECPGGGMELCAWGPLFHGKAHREAYHTEDSKDLWGSSRGAKPLFRHYAGEYFTNRPANVGLSVLVKAQLQLSGILL